MKHDSHESARLHVTGEALYTHDLALRAGAVLHAFPVQSDKAHGNVVHIDTSVAERMPGVHCVLTCRDVPGENDTGPVRHDEPLFPRVVMYHGQPLAWVVADSEAQARQAAERVSVQLMEQPALTTLAEAIDKQSFLSELLRIERGDVESALAGSAHRLEGELYVGGQEHFYLETQAAFALYDENGDMLVHSSTQHPTETQHIVARVLGLPQHRVICQSLRMGGAFGGKEVQANGIAAVAALAAHKTGRPVSVRLDRKRDMTITGKRHAFLGRFRVGFAPDG
jgi:xanthine dehydrogenase large subunit